MTLTGVSTFTYGLYELAFQLNTLFQHSNLRLPIGFERALNLFLLHRACTASTIPRCAPRRNPTSRSCCPGGTVAPDAAPHVPQAAIVIGVPGYSRPGDNRLWHAISLPFRRQRRYWLRPDGTEVTRAASQLGPDPGRLEP